VCGYAQQEVADCFSLTHRGSVSSSVRVIEEKLHKTASCVFRCKVITDSGIN